MAAALSRSEGMPEPINRIAGTAGFSRIAGGAFFDPIEARLRMNVRAIIA
jgi:hypothetical protein